MTIDKAQIFYFYIHNIIVQMAGLRAIAKHQGADHLKMVGSTVYQLTCNLSEEEIKKAGFDVRCFKKGKNNKRD